MLFTIKQKKITQRNKTKKNKNKVKYNNKLTIDIDFSAKDGGFSTLRSNKVFSFLRKSIKKGNNLIQTVPGKPFYANKKTKLYLQAIQFSNFTLTPEWNKVLCKSHGKLLKSSPCKIGTRKKVFVKYKGYNLKSKGHFLNQSSGFASYLYQILRGEIDEKKHIKFANILRKTMKNDPIVIHNMDVNWFHLKSDA
jgi:hypothetical protein